MSIVDDLISNLVERNAVRLNGTLGITFADGRIAIKGTIVSTIRDRAKNRDILNVDIPVDSTITIDPLVLAVPTIP